MNIQGVTIIGEAIFSYGSYSVFVGLIPDNTNRDIPHYLLVNTETKVVEGSSARLFEARGMCEAYGKELEAQNDLLSNKIDLVTATEPDGNTDPKKVKKKQTWGIN